MLVHVKTPRIELDIKGDKYQPLIDLLKKDFGDSVEIYGDEYVDITETDWFNETEVTPGETVRIYRENHNLTQKELGEKLGGKTRQFVSDIEKGRRKISIETAKALGKVFQHDYRRYL